MEKGSRKINGRSRLKALEGWLFTVLMWVGVQRERERVCEKSQEEM
jgi:hypothetical protein